ncbi:MAG: macro domain-containing protein, partial [Lachnospiraceae bacterium]|nr:macro domain-containing protein [Lachnospiraceae bacterium]
MAFQIIRNDITKVAADAIVNTANPDPCYGSGTDGAIYAAAGADELLAERAKIGTMEVGEAKATPAFALPAKYIIHTVGPAWDGGEHGEFENLRKCYENSLKLAGKLGCESIAFPLISTGVYGFPKDKALQTAISVFSEFLSDHEMEITLVVFDPKSFELSGQIFAGVDEFIDNNYVTEQIDEEYGSEEAFGHLAHSEPRRR